MSSFESLLVIPRPAVDPSPLLPDAEGPQKAGNAGAKRRRPRSVTCMPTLAARLIRCDARLIDPLAIEPMSHFG